MSTPGWVDCCPRSTDDLIGGSNVSCTTVKHRSGSAGSVQLVGWKGGVRHEDERWKRAVGRVEWRCQTRRRALEACSWSGGMEVSDTRLHSDDAPGQRFEGEHTKHTVAPTIARGGGSKGGKRWERCGWGGGGNALKTQSCPHLHAKVEGRGTVVMRMMVRLMAVGTHNTHSRRGSRWARMARCGWMVVRIEVQCNMRTCAPQQMRAHHTTHPHTLLNKKRSVGG
jgi:hypothetical protein